jgi:predicted MFS family arabinose efflux permease
MTFAVAHLRQQSVPASGISAFWITIGITIWAAGRLWAGPISRSLSGRLAGLMYLMMAMSSAAIAFSDSFVAVMGSAIVFGAVFVAVVAATTHLIRRNVSPHRWTAVFARFTVGFGLALTVGSGATGAIADKYSLTAGVLTAAAALAAAAVAAALQPDPVHHSS